MRVRVLSRGTTPQRPQAREVNVYIGDLADRQSLNTFLDGVDYLVNLAHPETPSDAATERLCDQLAEACCTARIRRFLHVSTATVVGTTRSRRVDETTPCRPASRYEHRKWLIEQRLAAGLTGKIDFAILRPTAIFGPHSRNLLKLMQTIVHGPLWKRHLLRYTQGRRRMHLVPIEDVIDTIVHLLFSVPHLADQTYLIACDTHPDNHYQAVDAWLGRALDKPLPLHSAMLPRSLLQLALRAAGRTQTNPAQYFDNNKLQRLGIHTGRDFTAALQRFAQWYVASKGTPQ